MYVILIVAMVFISATLAGIFAPPFGKLSPEDQVDSAYFCCDTGDGDKCKARDDVPTIRFRNDEYGLLKSNSYPFASSHQFDHFEHTNTAIPGVGRVFTNVGNRGIDKDRSESCTVKNMNNEDWIRGGDKADDEHGSACISIPENLIIYVCTYDNEPSGICDKKQLDSESVHFDIYIRLRSIKPGGKPGFIPEVLTTCNKPKIPEGRTKSILFRPSPGGQDNLQLRTFRFVEEPPKVRWAAPYCKPAIYLYPEKKTELNVSVFPKGKMLLTIPEYPKLGWDVVAEPNGDIYSAGKRFDYLYYEASIPDELVAVPDTGYVIAYEKREQFMRELVIKLGLNEKETNQFVEYWTPILPKSPYYFIGIVPVSNLDTISPVLITPKPDNFLRVTLYFQPIDTYKEVIPPNLDPFTRSGFTAVEWGGIYKQDKDHAFSCFM